MFSIRNNEQNDKMLWKSSRVFYEERSIRLELELLKHLDNTGMPFRVSDPHDFYVDPDAAFHFDADPDPDPAPLQSEGNLRPRGSVLSL